MVTTNQLEINTEQSKRTRVASSLQGLRDFASGLYELSQEYSRPLSYGNLRTACGRYRAGSLKEDLVGLEQIRAAEFVSRKIDALLKILPEEFAQEAEDKTNALAKAYNGLTFEQRIDMTEPNYRKLEAIIKAPGRFGKVSRNLQRSADALIRYLNIQ